MSIQPSIPYSALGLRARPPAISALMSAALENPNLLSLAAGFTDTETLPATEFTAAATRLAARPGPPDWLQYGTTQGRVGLRQQLAERLRQTEPALPDQSPAERILVTNGSQQALYLAIQTLCDPGDVVLVDRPTYFVLLEMLAALGVVAEPLPQDDAGRLDLSTLEQQLARHQVQPRRLKAVYFVSYYSNPSGRCLAEADKCSLARLLAEKNLYVPVIEDAAYRELYFHEPYVARSSLTLEPWKKFPRLYAGTLTKPLASGAKVGWAYCTNDDWLARLVAAKGSHDFGTSNYAQALCEEVIRSGAFATHLDRIRASYYAKMRALHDAFLSEGLRALGWDWSEPGGGLYLWLRAPDKLDTGADGAFCRTCLQEGVLYVPGELCFAGIAPRNFIRVSYGVLAPAQLREAARRFVAVAKRFA